MICGHTHEYGIHTYFIVIGFRVDVFFPFYRMIHISRIFGFHTQLNIFPPTSKFLFNLKVTF